MRDCPKYKSGRHKIYNAQEAQNVGDIGQSIPHIYASLDNKQAEHHAFIIEMDGKICHRIISILICSLLYLSNLASF